MIFTEYKFQDLHNLNQIGKRTQDLDIIVIGGNIIYRKHFLRTLIYLVQGFYDLNLINSKPCIITAFSEKFKQQHTQTMMNDLNSFVINLCKQWDSIIRLPDLLEFSVLLEHQQNQITKPWFESINFYAINYEMKQIIKNKIQKMQDLQDEKESEVLKIYNEFHRTILYEFNQFKNQNKIQRKVCEKYEKMIYNRIKSSRQEIYLELRNEIQNYKIEFQKKKGFSQLDQFIEKIRKQGLVLQHIQNDDDEIKQNFEELWEKITVTQQEAHNQIFDEHKDNLFSVITNEFQELYLSFFLSESPIMEIFMKKKMTAKLEVENFSTIKKQPSIDDFESIFDNFKQELREKYTQTEISQYIEQGFKLFWKILSKKN